ncbi:MAG: hypothetical protein ABWZ40_04740, partial [Caulobacterales bacterium]
MASENPLQDAHTLQIHVSSHLKFSLNEQPGSDDDLTQLANVFALEFGQILKSRLNAISVRYAKVQGRHAASSVTNVVLYCVFSRSSTAQSAKEFLSRLNPIAETWAD